jgi:addiction module HigA family antidote
MNNVRSLRDPKRAPTHPGAILRMDVFGPLKLTQSELAKRLGVSRLSISELLLEKRSLTPDMAIRIGILTKTDPESWLRMQQAYDVWTLAKNPKRYKQIEPLNKKVA